MAELPIAKIEKGRGAWLTGSAADILAVTEGRKFKLTDVVLTNISRGARVDLCDGVSATKLATFQIGFRSFIPGGYSTNQQVLISEPETKELKLARDVLSSVAGYCDQSGAVYINVRGYEW